MPAFTKLGVLALAVPLSINLAVAQQSVRRLPAKATAQSQTSSVRKVAATPVRRSVATSAPAPKTTDVTSVPEQTPAVARQAETQPQSPPLTRTTSARPQMSMAHGKRNVYLNAGVGLATYYAGGFPIGVSVEVEAKNNFSVGGSIDYYRYSYGYYSGGYNFIYAGARGSYHLGEALNVQSRDFDPYIGATLGFRYAGAGGSYSYADGYGYNSGLYVGIHVGARLMLSQNMGAFAEVGYGVSAVKLGLAAKF